MILRCNNCKVEITKRLAVWVMACKCGGMLKPIARYGKGAAVGVDAHPPHDPGKFYCVWCGDKFWKGQRTREHLKPMGLGGKNTAINIAYACGPCNNDRNRILNFVNMLKVLHADLDQLPGVSLEKAYRLRLRIRSAWAKLPAAQEHLKHWIELEKRQIGWSPHEKIKFELPTIEELDGLLPLAM